MTTAFPTDPRAIDLMIAFPFKKADVDAFLREQAKDDESKAGSGDLVMPAGYMFSDVGDGARSRRGWDRNVHLGNGRRRRRRRAVQYQRGI